jgi:hypothetical protein
MFIDDAGRLRPFWAFLLAVSISCVAFFACGYLASALTGDHVVRFEAIFRLSLAAVLLGVFSWLLAVGNHVESNLIAAQGLPLSPGWGRQFLFGGGLGLVLVTAAVFAVALFGKLSFRTTLTLHSVTRVWLVLLILLAGSLAEELMFRGYPFQRLVEAIGAGGAIMVFSVLFALVHLMNPGASFWGLTNTLVIGVMLSIAYLRTHSLWLPWGFHFAWNATLGLIYGLPVSGIRLFNVMVHTTAVGPKWLTGGSYGIEASLPGALVVLLGLVVVWRAPLLPLKPATALVPPGPNPADVATPTHRPPELGL